MTIRQDIVTWARWCVEHKTEFEYSESRPMPLNTIAPIKNDCSGTFTLCYFLAHAPDPNGPRYNYDGEGFTGTLVANGTEVTLEELLPADAVIYYQGVQSVHVALVIEPSTDPLTMSHGQPSEPAFITVAQDGRPHKFFRFDVPEPAPVPTTIPTQGADVEDLFITKNPSGPGDYFCSWSARTAVGIPSGAIEKVLTDNGCKRVDLDAATFAYFAKETWKK